MSRIKSTALERSVIPLLVGGGGLKPHTTIDNALLPSSMESEPRTLNSELTLQLKESPNLKTHSTCIRQFQHISAFLSLYPSNVWGG